MAKVNPQEFDLPDPDEVAGELQQLCLKITMRPDVDVEYPNDLMMGVYLGCKLTLGDRSKGLALALWGNGNTDYVSAHEAISHFLAETIDSDVASFLFTRGIIVDVNTVVKGKEESEAVIEALMHMKEKRDGDG